MAERRRIVVVLLLAALAGCGGEDDRNDETAEKPVDGTFVGEVSGTSAFVAVVAAPAPERGKRRDVTVYVSDGRRVSESFSGTATGNGFVAASQDGDGEVKGKLSGQTATGTIAVPDRKAVRYTVRRAAAAAGLYELKVSSGGKLTGTSATGVALKGTSTLPKPGTGTLRLADGTRLKFDIVKRPDGDPIGLQPGEVRLIVMPDGQLTGAGTTWRNSDFFIRPSE